MVMAKVIIVILEHELVVAVTVIVTIVNVVQVKLMVSELELLTSFLRV
jgi:hypothetical protein